MLKRLKLAVFLLLASAAFGQATVSLIPIPLFPSFTNQGTVNSGGFVYTYVTGTSTPLAAYTDYTGNTPNTNPIQLNSYGYPQTAGGSQVAIWLVAGSAYRIVVQNSSHVQQYVIDGVLSSAVQPITVIGASSTSSSGVPQGFASIPLIPNATFAFRCHGWYKNSSNAGVYSQISVQPIIAVTSITAGIRMFTTQTGTSADTSSTVSGTSNISLSTQVGTANQMNEFWVEGIVSTSTSAASLNFAVDGNASGTATVASPYCVAYP